MASRRSTLPVATYAFYQGRKVKVADLEAVCAALGEVNRHRTEHDLPSVSLERKAVTSPSYIPPHFRRGVMWSEVRRKGFRQ
jgi:hypothetical protein